MVDELPSDAKTPETPSDSDQSQTPTPEPSPPEPSPPEPSPPESSAKEPSAKESSPPDSSPPETVQNEDTSSSSNLDEEMPEYEELSPELMEDECLRGDVMLRWALGLLALLLSWTYLTESSLLVKIRSGEYMLAHGFLPPRVDHFSASADGLPWVNLEWLSDLMLGGLYQIGGMPALTVFCAVTVTLAFYFLAGVNVAGVSTWWGSVCGFLALIALFPMFQPGPSTITILGLALLMLCLFRAGTWTTAPPSETPSSRQFWSLPLLPLIFLLWANTDLRCWVGVVLLVLFVVGDSITRVLRKVPQSGKNWGITLLSVALAILVSPWPGRPALAPLMMLHEHDAIREYVGISEFFPRLVYEFRDPIFWKLLDIYAIASLTLIGLSLLTMLMNFRRLNLGWLAVWIGINLLGFVNGSAVCYAAIVNAAIATFYGQEWYRHRFSMEYSIDTWSVLWGRGGRAAMVLGFFLVAYLGINGALMGPQSRRLGTGLDPRWTNRIESLQDTVLAHTFSDHIFPTLPMQGDVLIWLEKKPFVDSRLSLYLEGPEDLLSLHRRVRTSLFGSQNPDEEVETDLWKETLLEFETYDVLVRLWGPIPPYDPMLRMMSNPNWSMTGFGAAGADFTRTDLPNPELKKLTQEHQALLFSQRAFRPQKKPETVELKAIWPAPVSRYDRWLVQKLEVAPNSAQLAAHYDALLSLLSQRMSIDQVSGLTLMTIHQCRRALAENPNHPLAYRALLRAYRLLEQVEQQVTQKAGANPPARAFEHQILAAAYAAVEAGGENSADLIRLLDVLLAQQQLDTALSVLNRIEAIKHDTPAELLTTDQISELDKLKEEIQPAVEDVQTKILKAQSDGAIRPQLVSMALQGRCPSLALSILEEDLTELQKSPELKLIYISLLLRNGRVLEALQEVEGMESMINAAANANPVMQPILTQWREIAATMNLATHDPQRAVELWKSEQSTVYRRGLQALMQMPFASTMLPVQHDIWPAYYARMATAAVIEVPERWGQLQLQMARAELEVGHLEEATRLLQVLLKEHPHFSQRPVAAYYLSQLTNKSIEPVLPGAKPPADQKEKPPEKRAASEEKPAQSPEKMPATKSESKPRMTPESKPAKKPESKPAKKPEKKSDATQSSSADSEQKTPSSQTPPSVPLPEKLKK